MGVAADARGGHRGDARGARAGGPDPEGARPARGRAVSRSQDVREGVAAADTLRALWLGASLAGAPPKLIYILALVSVAVSWIVIATAAAVLVVWVAILGRDGRYMWAALISVILAGAAAWLVRQVFNARARRAPAGR